MTTVLGNSNAGDADSISGSERSPGEGNGNPLQYSCLENPMDRGAWWATVHGVAKDMTDQLNNNNKPLWNQTAKFQSFFSPTVILKCSPPL